MHASDPLILSVDVVYLHTPHRELSSWYRDTLGLSPGYGDEGWQEFILPEGSRFALDFTSFPRSVVEKQAVMLSFRVADIHEAVRVLTRRGVAFYPNAEGAVMDVGPTLVATFCDPDGTWMQLSQGKTAASAP